MSHEPLDLPFNPGDLNPFNDVRDLESSNQRILRGVFEEIEATNRLALTDFDPRIPAASVDIELTGSFHEAEIAEPQLAASKRQVMLHSLGLTFQHLDSGNSDRIFEYQYRGGEVDQIRLLAREDGMQVPVYTALGSNKDGNPVERVRLLSYTQAAELATRLENGLDEQKLDERLTSELGLDETMLELAELNSEDKRSMLAAFDEIQNLEVVKPDTAELNRIRRNLVKAMLPGTKFMPNVRGNRLEKARAAYEDSVSSLVERYELDTKSTRELVRSEQLFRLKALNEQLQSRKRATKIGLLAMSSLVTIVGTGTGAASGVFMAPEMNDGTVTAAGIGALIGGGFGLWIGIEQGLRLRKQTRHISGFSTGHFDKNSDLSRQLRDEQRIANAYITLLNH